MNDKFSLRDYPLKAASLYVSALSFILENTIVSEMGYDVEEIEQEIEEDQKRANSLNLIFDFP